MEILWIQVLLRRKIYLIALLALSLVLAGVLTKFLPKTYSVTNGIRVGKFMGVPLETPEFTKQRFKQVGFLADAFEAAGLTLDGSTDQFPSTVRVNIKDDLDKKHNVDTLIFCTRHEDPAMARDMNRALTNHLIRLHGQKIDQARAIRQREVEAWQEAITETRRSIEDLAATLEKLGSQGGIHEAAVFLMTAKIEEQRSLLVRMLQDLHNVILKISNPVESYNTEIISKVRLPQKPDFPKFPLLCAGLILLAGIGWAVGCYLELVLVSAPGGNNRATGVRADSEPAF